LSSYRERRHRSRRRIEAPSIIEIPGCERIEPRIAERPVRLGSRGRGQRNASVSQEPPRTVAAERS
jgi:hypothetical protein